MQVDDKYSMEEEYSLNNEEDFQLSASLKKSEGANPSHKTSLETKERLLKLQRLEDTENKKRAIKEKVEAELRKIDASDSESSENGV